MAQNVFLSAIDKLVQNGTPILVTDPRRVGEGRDSHVEYLVQIEGHAVRRRFSEFDSFREALVKAIPTCIIPPLPDKDGLTLNAVSFNLLASNTPVDPDALEKRRVHLQSFLNRIAKHPILSAQTLFHRFLEAEAWTGVKVEESVSLLNSASVSSILGGFNIMSARVQRPEARFLDLQNHSTKFGQQIAALERNCRRLERRQSDLGGDYAELGAIFQSFASNEKELAQALTKTGEAVDGVFLSSRFMVSELGSTVLEPMQEYISYVNSIKTVLRVHEQRHATVEAMMDQLQGKRDQLKSIEAQLNGQATAEPVTASSLFRRLGSMLDSNPQQTMRDNMTKLQTSVQELEVTADGANSELTKSSEAILNDFDRFNKEKARDFKQILLSYAKIEMDFHHKNKALWENVIPVIDKTSV